MIEWIKFKGSTEEEVWNEIKDSLPVCVCGLQGAAFTVNNGCYSSATWHIPSYPYWAPLNLPQEEKWERKENFHDTMNDGKLLSHLNQEFDNIYSKLNELRKR